MTLPADHLLAGPAAPPPCAATLAEIRTAGYEVPNTIGGREVLTGQTMPIVTPHAHAVQLGQVHCASPEQVGAAIEAAANAARWWVVWTGGTRRAVRPCSRHARSWTMAGPAGGSGDARVVEDVA